MQSGDKKKCFTITTTMRRRHGALVGGGRWAWQGIYMTAKHNNGSRSQTKRFTVCVRVHV